MNKQRLGSHLHLAPAPDTNPPVDVIGQLLKDCWEDLARKVQGQGRVPVELPTLKVEMVGGVITAHMDVLTRRKRWWE